MNKLDKLHTDLFVKHILLTGYESDVSDDLQIKLTWLEKYFLIRVLHIYGFDIVISEPIDNLVPTLGISPNNITQLQKTLEQLGILSFVKVSKGPGRPARSFKIDSDCLKARLGVNLDIKSVTNHTALIGSLLCWGRRDIEACCDLGQGAETRSRRAYLKDKNHKLDGKNRYFIAMLLAHADEFGFVESLGHADIEALTGLSPAQQRRLVTKLKESGYIRSSIRGFTNPKIFDRVKTVYCLNTHSAEISGLEPIALTLFRDGEFRTSHEKSESDRLHWIASPRRKQMIKFEENEVEEIEIRSFIGDLDTLKCIKPEQIRLLKGDEEDKYKFFYTYLQYRLESYACWFLSISEYMGDSSTVCEQEFQNIRQRIQAEVSPCSDIKEITEEEKDFSNLLYEIATAMANTYYQFLNKYHNESLTTSDRAFRIFPRDIQDLRANLSLAIANRASHSGQELTPCIYIQRYPVRLLYSK